MSSDQLQVKITQVVNGSLGLEAVLLDLENLIQARETDSLRLVMKELVKGCNSKSSWIVENSTKIIQQIIQNPTDELLDEFNGQEFQAAIMYTLRGKTTRFGNKFSMHREMWKTIEQRVLGFYALWFKQCMMREDKAQNILKNYRTLRSYNIKFPDIDTTTIIPTIDTSIKEDVIQNSTKEIKLSLETEKESLETFLQEYEKMIQDGIDESIIDSIEFKIKQKLIYALNNVLLYEDSSVRLKKAIQYNKRFNNLLQKLSSQSGRPLKQKKIVSAKNIPPVSQIKQKQVVEPTKTSGIRSLIRSTIAYISSQPNTKDPQTKQKVMTKLDETIGDLVKYFDNHEDVDVENMATMTKSSLY